MGHTGEHKQQPITGVILTDTTDEEPGLKSIRDDVTYVMVYQSVIGKDLVKTELMGVGHDSL